MLTTRWSRLVNLDGQQADEAWAWFVNRYRPFVTRLLHRHRGDYGGGCADEFWAFLWTAGAIQRADPSRSFRNYLRGIVRNFAHKQRARANDLAWNNSELVAEEAEPECERLEHASWVKNVLANALAVLPPRQAEVLRLFYGIDCKRLDASACAVQLRLSTKNIYVSIHKARGALGEAIKRELWDTVHTSEQHEDELSLIHGELGRTTPGLLVFESE